MAGYIGSSRSLFVPHVLYSSYPQPHKAGNMTRTVSRIRPATSKPGPARRSPQAADLASPRYRSRVIPDKRKQALRARRKAGPNRRAIPRGPLAPVSMLGCVLACPGLLRLRPLPALLGFVPVIRGFGLISCSGNMPCSWCLSGYWCRRC
jgi:hypothetical protein